MAENRREEQKLWLILFQIKAIRTRLNLLAIQYWLFVTVAIAIVGVAMIFILAAMMSPLVFVVTAAIVSISALAAMVRAARTAVRRSANPVTAAILADDRAALKGRLTTVLALAADPPQSSLWPYLLEDTYGLRQRFEPARIEPRWISRSIIALAAACLMVGGLGGALRYYAGRQGGGLAQLPADITADIGDLEVLPADPAAKANARVYADAATIRQLEAKLANAKKGGLSAWMEKARTLAGNLQDQVTGRNPLQLPSIHLKSSQPPSSGAPPTSQVARSAPPGPADDQAGNHPAGAPMTSPPGTAASGNPVGSSPPPPVSIPGGQADQMTQNNPSAPSPSGMDPSSGGVPDQAGATLGNGSGVGGGTTHGSGADPEHLFGPPAPQQLGSDSFKIAIDAEPSDETSIKGAPAYIPPKVRVPLNANQFPDEPLARASVPPGDQMTIKRVFER